MSDHTGDGEPPAELQSQGVWGLTHAEREAVVTRIQGSQAFKRLPNYKQLLGSAAEKLSALPAAGDQPDAKREAIKDTPSAQQERLEAMEALLGKALAFIPGPARADTPTTAGLRNRILAALEAKEPSPEEERCGTCDGSPNGIERRDGNGDFWREPCPDCEERQPITDEGGA